MPNADTTSCELNQLEMLAFSVQTNGHPTFSLKDSMSSMVIFIDNASSRQSSFVLCNVKTYSEVEFNAQDFHEVLNRFSFLHPMTNY